MVRMYSGQSVGQIVKVGGYVAMLVGGGFHRHSNKTNRQKITSGTTLGNHDGHQDSGSDAPERSAAVCRITTTKGLFSLAFKLKVLPVHGGHSAVATIDDTSLLFASGDVLWKSRLHALMIFGTLGGLTSSESKGWM